MNDFNSKNDNKINQLSLPEILLTINNWQNILQNEINLLAYLESSINREKYNLQKNEKQIISFTIKKLKLDSININKQIEEFSINYSNFNNYKKIKNNHLEDDEMVKYALKELDEKYNNIIIKNRSFIDKYPFLKDLREKFVNSQKFSFSQKNVNKKKNKSLSIKIKNTKSVSNINKFSILPEKRINSNSNGNENINLDDNTRKLRIDLLKEKIKKIQINIGQGKTNENERTLTFNDKEWNTPSNKYINELKYNSFINNDSKVKYNILNGLTNSTSKEKLCITKKESSIKSANQKIISNQNFLIQNSCNSSINLNINHNQNNKNNINNLNNKIIPNNYRNKITNQTNFLENNQKLNTNPNLTDFQIKAIKSFRNNKTFNFPLKNILLEQKNKKKLKFKKIKSNIILKEKDKENFKYSNNSNNTPKCQEIAGLKNNNLNSNNGKILYTKSLRNGKRSNSEYFLRPLRSETFYRNNNNSFNYNDNKLRGISFDNLNLNKFEIQNKITNFINKKKAKIRNRAINVFNDNETNKIITPNRNMSFSFANKKLRNYNLFENEKNSYNDNLLFDYELIKNTIEENKKLNNEIYFLKKEIENIRFICQKLSSKVTNLEDENEILKKENKAILKLLNINKE